MSGRRVTPQAQLVLPSGANQAAWMAARRSGITATDVVKIVGLSRHGDPVSVYLDKRLGEDSDAGEAAQWGHLLEDQVAREWARRHDARIRRVGLVQSIVHPHHMATCDRLVVSRRCPLEVKTRSAWVADDWDDGQGGVRVPEPVAVQCQWQAHVLGADEVPVAALIGGQRLVSAVVERDDIIINYLRSEADRVWAAVQAGVPPEVEPWQLSVKVLDRLHPDRVGAVAVDPQRARPLIEQYRSAAAAEKAAQADKAAARVQLLALLGDAEAATVDDLPAYTYRATTQTDIPAERARALLAARPDLAEYAVTKTVRRFTLAKEPR